MLILFVTLIVVIAVLSYFDEISTQLNIRKSGLKVEENEVVKELEREGGESYVFLYKLAAIIGFSVIGWYIYNINHNYFYFLAGLVILTFLVVVIRNMEIFENEEA